MKLIPYIKQIAAHRKRMKRWAIAYSLVHLDENPVVKPVLHIHDIEKWLYLPWLFYYQQEGRDRTAARKLYDEMNKVGSLIVKIRCMFYNKNDFKEALQWEHIFDVLDRNNDPVALEEFRIEVAPPLSQFLSGIEVIRAEQYKPWVPYVFQKEKEDATSSRY